MVRDNGKDVENGALFAVIGAFLKVGSEEYPALQIALDNKPGQYDNLSIGPADMIKDSIAKSKRKLATYSGGLTTPPFSECVMWYVVLDDLISITQEQKTRYLQANGGKENAREC